MQGYNYKVVHTKGNTNSSDFMSRHPIDNMKNNDLDSAITRITKNNDKKISGRAYKQWRGDYKCKKALLVKTLLESEYRPFKDELAITNDGLLLKQNKIVIPKTLKKKVVKLAHMGHQGIEKAKSLLRSKV